NSFPPMIMAGVSLYVGLYHLLIYARRKSHPEDLTFGLLCLTTCLYEVMCTGLYNAASTAEGGRWQRLQFISLALFVTAFLWFVSDYTKRKRGAVVYGFTVFYLAAIVVQIVDRSRLTWVFDLPAIKHFPLLFGSEVTYYEVTLGPFTTIQGLVGLAATGYIIWCGVLYYRRGNRQEAVPLLVALGVMTGAALNDTAVSDGLYCSLYLIEYAYMAMILLMAVSLSRAVIDAAVAREALRKAELVIRYSPVVLFRWKAETDWPVEYVSENIRQFGYTPQQLLSGGLPYASLVHPDDRGRVAAEVTGYVEAGMESFTQEYRILTNDGQVRWLDDRTTVLRGADGAVTHFQGIVVDITDQRRIEAALLDSEEKYRTLVENALVGIFTVNNTYQFIYCNDEMCRITARPREWIVNRDFRDILAPESIPVVTERYLLRRQGVPLPSRYEINILRSDGETRHVEMSVALVKDAGGVPRTMGQLVDITDRTRAEAEIRRLNAELEQRVRDRTAELEAAAKELEAFSYSVSHDLRAPLRSMSGFARILLQDHAAELTADASRFLTTIYDTARQMGQLIDDLLTFSRLNRQPLVRQECSMEGIVRQALDALGDELAGRSVEVTMDALPRCSGDSSLLRQVWVNLLSNAFKYTRRCDHARVQIGCAVQSRETVYFVRDNGVGFDMRYADKLFGVFQRLHRDDEFEGTGIGLAIVKRIVTRHGGRVWAESAPDAGACF
ncbi:MAG TPA: PAS domain S-box protein, partial [Spirochaetia bacterium]|nr:PAS domain S-box protein [Spirochaetia bacterium]